MGSAKAAPLPKPKVVRMPLVDDPNKQAARANRKDVLNAKGRRSTMLSELTQGTAGSVSSTSNLGGGTA